MFKKIVPITGKMYRQHFPKVGALKRSTKGAKVSSFRRALFIAFYQQKVIINEMLQQFWVSTNEIYQGDFLKVAVLNDSTKGSTL